MAIPSKSPLSNSSKALLLLSSNGHKEIIPYGFDLSKKLDALALTVVPSKVTPIHSSQSYFAQATHHPVIAPLPRLEDKPRQQEPKLDVQKLIKVTKEINLLPPKGHEVLTEVKTNKFGDVTCARYKSVTSRTTIDGVRAMPEQIKVVPPKERKRKVSSAIPEVEEKHPRTTIALLEKNIEDLSYVIYTLEQRINEEHVYHKSLQHDLNTLNHFVAKMRK
jgi:hypothetical protein